jgi:hypothetical protein
MQAELKLPRDRRAFLRGLARYPVLAGLALLGGVLAWRRQGDSSAAACLKQRVCRDCALYSGCELPRAMTSRRNNL